MKSKLPSLRANPLDDLFSTEEDRQDSHLEKVIKIPVNEIVDFKNHPFRVRMDKDMIDLIDSVKDNGILMPALVRPNPYGKGYEMVSGHRRKFASIENGIDTIDALVRDLNDDQATIIMVDSNIQRERILPTERGFAFKMKLEAMDRQLGRPSIQNGSQVGNHLKGKKSIEVIAEEAGQSKNQIHRYIRLTELIEPLRDMVDGISESGKKIAFNPAVELSYLSKENQEFIVEYIDMLDLTPSHAQTIRMKELSREGRLDGNVIYSIMTEQKANQKVKLSIKVEDVKGYFPDDYSEKQMTDKVIELLQEWAKERQREKRRERKQERSR